MKGKEWMMDIIAKLNWEMRDGTVLFEVRRHTHTNKKRGRDLVWLRMWPLEWLRGVSCFHMSEKNHTCVRLHEHNSSQSQIMDWHPTIASELCRDWVQDTRAIWDTRLWSYIFKIQLFEAHYLLDRNDTNHAPNFVYTVQYYSFIYFKNYYLNFCKKRSKI